jgi:hypothetical protein
LLFTFNVHPSSNLTAFPNLILGTYAGMADTGHGGYVTQTTTLNGQTVPADLVFTSDAAGTTLLSWEVESWNNTTGAIVAWVKSDRLAVSDTLIYAWAGKSSVTTYQCTASATWSAYSLVSHYPNGTTLSTVDSSANALTPSSSSGVTAGAGQLSGGAVFDGSHGIAYPSEAALNNWTTQTISFWMYAGSNGQYHRLAESGDNNGWAILTNFYSSNEIDLSIGGITRLRSTASLLNSLNWHHIVVEIASDYSAKLYVDGVLDTTSSATSAPAKTVAFFIGQYGGGGYNYTGTLDEFRISSGSWVPSADWIAHEYTQQSQASAWYTVGSWTP